MRMTGLARTDIGRKGSGEPAEHRPRYPRSNPHDAHISLIAPTFARRDHVRDNGLGQRENAATTDTLQRATEHEHRHGWRQSTNRRPRDEYPDSGKHHGA